MRTSAIFITVLLSLNLFGADINLDTKNYVLVGPSPDYRRSGDPRPKLVYNDAAASPEEYEFTIDLKTPYQVNLATRLERKDPNERFPEKSRYMELEIDPTYNAGPGHPIVKEKVMLNLRNRMDKQDKNNGKINILQTPSNRQYVGFDIYFPEGFENPPHESELRQRTYLILFQALQQIRGSSPAFALTIKGQKHDSDDVIIQVNKRDTLGRNTEVVTNEFSLEKKKWYRIILQLQPAYKGSERIGQYALWVDGQRKLVHRGAWGFDPYAQSDPDRAKWLAMGLGIYRGSMDKRSKMRIKNIKTSRSFKGVR